MPKYNDEQEGHSPKYYHLRWQTMADTGYSHHMPTQTHIEASIYHYHHHNPGSLGQQVPFTIGIQHLLSDKKTH